MRKTLPMMLLAIFLATASIQGQQFASEGSQGAESNAKPCVVVFGAVRSPGRIEMRRQVRLREVLAAAGGLTARAGATIQLVHTGSKCFQSARAPALNSVSSSVGSTVLNISDLWHGEEKANPFIVAGDLVIVSEMASIYVVGNVVSPRAVDLKEPLTLTEAIKLADGVRSDAKTSKVVIYRQKDGAMVSVTIDLNEIRKHRTKDPILEPYDIVDVGGTGRPMPRLSYPIFDSRPLIPPRYRVIY